MPANDFDASLPSGAAAPSEGVPADLGPLAWVMEEFRKSLESVIATLRRQRRDPLASARGQEPARAAALTMARAQLHQAAGALAMVGLPAPARVVSAMEAALQVFIDEPARCEASSAVQVERAGFAVAEFLEGLLQGKSLSAVALFPPYRAVMELAGAERIHPADLWPFSWAWQPVDAPAGPIPPPEDLQGPALRSRLDQAVLRIVKSGDLAAAHELAQLCAGLAAGTAPQSGTPVRSLWTLAAGFFEALALSLLPMDLYVKRTASRVLVQFAALAKGEDAVSERLGRDLAFFCAQARPADPATAPQLTVVRQAWDLGRHTPVRYDQEQFGRFDPLLLSQVRKRLVAIRESWAALAGGDTSRSRGTAEQFSQLREALTQLHPPFAPLASGLAAVAQDTAQQGQAPGPELSMEVATALLFLEASCQDFDPADPQLGDRMQRLADRLGGVQRGDAPAPLEPWVQALYRRVSHRQTMGSVVDELRVSLTELEKDLDAYSRAPAQREHLQAVPGRLSQMRGVLSVLGLDQAARAATHMRDTVAALMQAASPPTPSDFSSLGTNLGALGFLVDMLSYQPALARKLFVFDEHQGELTPVMGRMAAPQPVPESNRAPDPAADSGWDAEVAPSLPETEVAAVQEAPVEEAPVEEAPVQEAPAMAAAVHEEPVLDAPPVLQAPLSDPLPDDRIKVIGPLRVDQALFNVYLNEADEWSRRLQVEVSEWGLDPRQPLPDSLVTLAHSLCGSSSMMGFEALANLARRLETSFQHTQALDGGGPRHAQVYTDAAEEIRRLLHQFAAGFLPESPPQWAHALDALDVLERVPPPLRHSGPAPTALAPGAGTQSEWASPVPESSTEGIAGSGVDPELFVFFEEEAQELLAQLGGTLRHWHARPENSSAREEVLRALHTLKGSARLAGAFALGAQAHALESRVEGFPGNVSQADIEAVIQGCDAFQAAFDALRAGASAVPVHPPANPSSPPGPLAPADPAAPDSLQTLDAQVPPAPVPSAVPAAPGSLSRMPAAVTAAPPLPQPSSRTGVSMVRVRTQTLDRLMNQTGEVMISRARLESEMRLMRGAMQELSVNVERLRAQLRDIELQSELQMQSRRTRDPATEFDPLEFDRFTRVQELTRMLAESVGDVATVQRTLQQAVDATEDHLLAQARQTRELQRDLLRTRMVEFESLADRLHRVVRLAAQESGKQVLLEIQGGSIEVDRGILERMAPVFEHLLRNAVAHGIEEPSRRSAAGKPVAGQVVIRLTQAGNDVVIGFDDDGSGLPLARIQEKARALGLLADDQPLDAAEAVRLIFTPGFSTAEAVSELAGRGIGMDVVRAEVQALGGRIETRTRDGQGTCFELVLPLTTAVTQVLMLRCGALVFGVPVPLVEGVINAPAAECQQALESGRFIHNGEALAFHWAGALLQSSPCSSGAQGRPAPVAILRSAAQRLALQVDEVLGHQEVVVKHLGPQLARLPGLAGITVLPSGAVVLIYNPVALAALHGEQARAFSTGRAPEPDADRTAGDELAPGRSPPVAQAPPGPLVLVVDDSSTVRRVTQRMLQREGYRVALAGDGLQAMEQLARETPAVVLSDIEMPRMDGFDLVRNLRADARWADLPVIMITSRIAQKHREHAQSLGVNHYLGKPYPEDELLALVKRYAHAALNPPSS